MLFVVLIFKSFISVMQSHLYIFYFIAFSSLLPQTVTDVMWWCDFKVSRTFCVQRSNFVKWEMERVTFDLVVDHCRYYHHHHHYYRDREQSSEVVFFFSKSSLAIFRGKKSVISTFNGWYRFYQQLKIKKKTPREWNCHIKSAICEMNCLRRSPWINGMDMQRCRYIRSATVGDSGHTNQTYKQSTIKNSW